MDSKRQASTYSRDPKTCGRDAPYEQKFANLVKLCGMAKEHGITEVVVAWPWVIGDTYEEMIESLSRIADAGLALHVTESQRGDGPDLDEIRRN